MVTKYFSKKDIPISTIPNVGRLMKVFSKQRPAEKNRSINCFVTLIKFLLAIWILKLGSAFSCIIEFWCAVVVFWSYAPDIALWTTLVSKNALVLYMLKRRRAYTISCFLSSCEVGQKTLYFGEHRFLSLVLDWKWKKLRLLVFGWKPLKSVLVVFFMSVVLVDSWFVGFPSSAVPGWKKWRHRQPACHPMHRIGCSPLAFNGSCCWSVV